MRTVAFCEIEPYCRAVLRKHWPDVPIYEDVRTLTGERLRADGISVDVICGGFPCQDISVAGKLAGIEAERSGLWGELCRIVGEVRPRYAIVENVSNLLSGPSERPGGWFGRVLGDLAAVGFDAEWDCIRASDVGAPHIRNRVWIVAYPCGDGHGSDHRSEKDRGAPAGREGQGHQRKRLRPLIGRGGEALANAAARRLEGGCHGHPDDCTKGRDRAGELAGSGSGIAPLANADRPGLSNRRQAGKPSSQNEGRGGVALAESERRCGSGWAIEPDVGRVAHGVPSRVDRLRGLGNAVVPQIPEIIGRAIMQAEAERVGA